MSKKSLSLALFSFFPYLQNRLFALEEAVDLEKPDTFFTFIERLAKADFMPHGHCFFWRGDILWLHVISDALIFFAYFSIPLMLLYFRKRIPDLPYKGILALFAAFIFWCGTTHAMNIVTLWNPVYRLEGVIKLITALISVATAILLFPIIPQALALRSPKEVEEERRRRQELEKFTHLASHDLREPLRTISLFTELLKQKEGKTSDPETQEYLSHIIKNSNRLADLIEDLGAYSRLDLDHLPLEEISISDCVKKAEENLEHSIQESKAEMTSSFSPSSPMIRAVPSQMLQLFQNLLSNAIKFQPPGKKPKIHIQGIEQDTHYLLSVSDNGIGFDPNFKEQVFLVFKRLHQAEDGYPGTGMGLAICKRIVEQHGGKIWVESEVGKGSTFYFTLRKKDQTLPPGKVRILD